MTEIFVFAIMSRQASGAAKTSLYAAMRKVIKWWSYHDTLSTHRSVL
jgi:hypothetical protein